MTLADLIAFTAATAVAVGGGGLALQALALRVGSEVPLALCIAASLTLSLVAVLSSRREEVRHGALVLGLAAGSAFGVMTLVLNALVTHPLLE